MLAMPPILFQGASIFAFRYVTGDKNTATPTHTSKWADFAYEVDAKASPRHIYVEISLG